MGQKRTKESISEREAFEKRVLFDKFITPHFDLIFKLCIDYSSDKSYVDDNYQECLLNFYRHIKTYDPTKKLLTWIHIVAKRFIIDQEKKRQRKAFDCVDICDHANTFVDSSTEDEKLTPDNYREYMSDEVLSALDELQPIYRDTLIRKICGYKLPEIMEEDFANGNLKKKSIDTVGSRLFLARKHLKDKLGQYYDQR